MRVIAGEAKGHHLRAPDHPSTRPLTDRAREGIFSALGDRVVNAQVLDLYAGSGSIGIEALSRGAARVAFVESSRKALQALRLNLATLGFLDRADISSQRVEDFLARTRDRYHLIFFDPPWSLATIEVAEEMLVAATLAEAHGEIIVHRRFPDALPTLPSGWTHLGTYRYGDTVLYRVAAPSRLGKAQ